MQENLKLKRTKLRKNKLIIINGPIRPDKVQALQIKRREECGKEGQTSHHQQERGSGRVRRESKRDDATDAYVITQMAHKHWSVVNTRLK